LELCQDSGAKRDILSNEEKIEEVATILQVVCGGGDEFLSRVHDGHGIQVSRVMETGGWI
jgi:hypothetical protein